MPTTRRQPPITQGELGKTPLPEVVAMAYDRRLDCDDKTRIGLLALFSEYCLGMQGITVPVVTVSPDGLEQVTKDAASEPYRQLIGTEDVSAVTQLFAVAPAEKPQDGPSIGIKPGHFVRVALVAGILTTSGAEFAAAAPTDSQPANQVTAGATAGQKKEPEVTPTPSPTAPTTTPTKTPSHHAPRRMATVTVTAQPSKTDRPDTRTPVPTTAASASASASAPASTEKPKQTTGESKTTQPTATSSTSTRPTASATGSATTRPESSAHDNNSNRSSSPDVTATAKPLSNESNPTTTKPANQRYGSRLSSTTHTAQDSTKAPTAASDTAEAGTSAASQSAAGTRTTDQADYGSAAAILKRAVNSTIADTTGNTKPGRRVLQGVTATSKNDSPIRIALDTLRNTTGIQIEAPAAQPVPTVDEATAVALHGSTTNSSGQTPFEKWIEPASTPTTVTSPTTSPAEPTAPAQSTAPNETAPASSNQQAERREVLDLTARENKALNQLKESGAEWHNRAVGMRTLMASDQIDAELAAAFVGNFVHETGSNLLNPATPQKDGLGYGIAQWGKGGHRYNRLVAFAKSINLPIDSIETQVRFVIDEITNDPTEVNHFKKILKVQQAAKQQLAKGNINHDQYLAKLSVAVRQYYERPGISHDSRRKTATIQTFNGYNAKLTILNQEAAANEQHNAELDKPAEAAKKPAETPPSSTTVEAPAQSDITTKEGAKKLLAETPGASMIDGIAKGHSLRQKYGNGQLHNHAGLLKGLNDGNPEHRMMVEAADAWNKMNDAFKAEFGFNIPIRNDAEGRTYRKLNQQTGSSLSAIIGTSRHGDGTAFDAALAPYAMTSNSASLAKQKTIIIWLRNNAYKFGYVQPSWALKGASEKYEVWHWEFHGNKAIDQQWKNLKWYTTNRSKHNDNYTPDAQMMALFKKAFA